MVGDTRGVYGSGMVEGVLNAGYCRMEGVQWRHEWQPSPSTRTQTSFHADRQPS